MLKEQALYSFFSGFGAPAFEENSVPTAEDRPHYPYITYEMRIDSFADFDVSSTFSIWDNNDSWGRIANISNQISQTIGRSGKVLYCDGGYILIYRDTPFSQAMSEPDTTFKRYLCSIKIRYYTSD